MGLSDRRISSPAFRGLVLKTFTSLATVVCVLAASPAAALPIVPVASRVALAGNDTLVWAGADGAALGSPHVQASVGGLNVAAFATAPALDLFLFIQNGSAFTANFTSGDRLLTTGFDDGPLTLSFATPIRGIGFNIVNQNFGMFTGTMQFLDLMNNSLGTVSVMGTSSAANDGSATATSVAISDPLPATVAYDTAYGTFIDGTVTSGSCNTDGTSASGTYDAPTTTVSKTIASVAATETKTLRFRATIK